MPDEQLIPEFVQAYYASQKALESGDRALATKAYADLLAAYKKLLTSSLDRVHKELAHEQVMLIHQSIQAIPKVTQLKSAPAQAAPAQDDLSDVQVQDSRYGAAAQASAQRAASAAADAQMSSSIEESTSSGFFSSLGVKDYVTLGIFAALILVVLFAKPATLGFVTGVSNGAPQWHSSQVAYSLRNGGQLAVDLANSFRDPDGDPLAFLATGDNGIDVSVTGSVALITAHAAGDHHILFIASDLVSVTKVPITIHVV